MPLSQFDSRQLAALAGSLGLERRSSDFFSNIATAPELDGYPLDMLAVAFNNLARLEARMKQESIIFPRGLTRGYAALVVGLFRGLDIKFVAVTCPEYLEGYRLGDGLSAESELYLSALPSAVRCMQEAGITVRGGIYVADTESDMPSVLNRLTSGNKEEFKRRCTKGAEVVRDRLGDIRDIVSVGLLTEFIPNFTVRQYGLETEIRIQMSRDKKFAKKVQRLSGSRRGKHEAILGRPEEDCELTVRYMAQYATLGEYLLDLNLIYDNSQFVIFNYPSPNLDFANFQKGKHRIPVFEILRRNL